MALGKVVLDQRRANPRHFVCANRGADSAAADCHTSLHLSFRDGAGQRNDEIRIIVAGDEAVRSEIDDLVSRSLETGEQVFLQAETTVIGSKPYAHVTPPVLLAPR